MFYPYFARVTELVKMATTLLQNLRQLTKYKHTNIRCAYNWTRKLKRARAKKLKFAQAANIPEHRYLTFPRLVSLDDASSEILPEEMKTYRERIEEFKNKGIDPELDKQINIGYAQQKKQMNRSERRKHMKTMAEMSAELEKKTRLGEVEIDSIEVQENYCVETGFDNIVKIAEHYGIFKDLYGDAYFYPQTKLRVFYDADEEYVNPVFTGNILEPSEVQRVPSVEYDFKPDTLYTLCMSGPDSHLQFNDKEYVHWLVGNIPGDCIKDGEELCDYLQPFPIKGTGFHRYVFVLYEQNKKIDFREDKRPANCTSLRERTFHTYEFYRKHQDDMTPVSLAFFQSEWDSKVTKIFWEKLEMREPGFEFVPHRKVIEKQELWPHKKPFNVYMDTYRDVKDINEEVLKEKLKTADPFKPREPRPKYPNSFRIDASVPTWRKQRIEEQRMRKNQWKDLDD